MQIVWEQSVYVGNVPVQCAICGHRSLPVRSRGNQLLLAVLYDRHGRARGEVCRDCVAAGTSGIQTRLEERIQALHSQLVELQTLAQEAVEVPTLEQEFEIHRQDAR